MKKFLAILFLPLVAQAQIWQISPLDPDPVEICQNADYKIAVTIWNNGTTPISGITATMPNEDYCPAILFQGASCMMYLIPNTKELGDQENTTHFRASPNYYEVSDYPIKVKACN